MTSTFARICPLAQLDTLVTDGPVPAALAAQLVDAGVEVVLAAAD